MFAFFVYYSYLYASIIKTMDFIKILELVESGVPISRALESLKISRSTFYKVITEQQKRLLDEARLLVKRDDLVEDEYYDDDTDNILYY
jgi:ACT domain-containing protein